MPSLHKTDEGSDQADENLRYEDLLDLLEEDIIPLIDIELAGAVWKSVAMQNWKNVRKKNSKIYLFQVTAHTRKRLIAS